MCDSSGCTRIDTLRHALEQLGGDKKALAARLGVSDRHLRRVFEEHLGVSPLQYLQTRKLLTAKQLLADPSEQVEVPGLGDRAPRLLSRQALAGVIEPRVEEIFSLVHQVIRESGYEELLSSGMTFTKVSPL